MDLEQRVQKIEEREQKVKIRRGELSKIQGTFFIAPATYLF